MLKQRLETSKVKCKLGLKREVNKVWRSITSQKCKRLIYAFPAHLKQIIKKKGERLITRRAQI